jgi:uncharacterized lipoprotein YehR (DUF1307 family)
MKRLYRIAVLLVFALAGCTRINNGSAVSNTTSSDEKTEIPEKILTCSKDSNVTQFRYRSDEIISTIITINTPLSQWSDADTELDTDALLEEVDAALQEKYKDLKGVTVVSRLEEDEVQAIVTINYLIADFPSLYENGLLTQGEVEDGSVSLTATREEFEQNGYVCEAQ